MKLFTHGCFIKGYSSVIGVLFVLNCFGQWGGSTGTSPSIPSGLQYHSSGSSSGSNSGGGGSGYSGPTAAQLEAQRQRAAQQAAIRRAREALDRKYTQAAVAEENAHLAKVITKLYNQSATINSEGQAQYQKYAQQKAEIEARIYQLEQKIKESNFASQSPPQQFREADFKEMHETPAANNNGTQMGSAPLTFEEMQRQRIIRQFGPNYADKASMFTPVTSSGPDADKPAESTFTDKALDLLSGKLSNPVVEWHAILADEATKQIQGFVNGTLKPEEAGPEAALLKTNVRFIKNEVTGMATDKAIGLVESTGSAVIGAMYGKDGKVDYGMALDLSKQAISRAKQGMQVWGIVHSDNNGH